MEIKFVKNILIEFLASVFYKLMRNKLETIVRIEGGLGSQLIGVFTYEAKKIENPKIRADISYFTKRTEPTAETGISIRDWELDSYGYHLNYFAKHSKFYDKYLSVINSRRKDKLKSNVNDSVQIPWRTFAKKLPIADGLDK